MNKGYIIAIDGPVASGKGTIAKGLASRLNAFFLTTGMFYRAVTYYCLQHNISLEDSEAVKRILPDIKVSVSGDTTILNGENVTDKLKHSEVDKNVTVVANYPFVREYLIPIQRAIGVKVAQEKIVIAEGRDMATKVFPNAEVKIYLTAELETRAKRRYIQQNLETNESLQQVLEETRERDENDMFGELQYLVSEPERYGYTVIDDTNLTEEQTIERILRVIDEVRGYKNL